MKTSETEPKTEPIPRDELGRPIAEDGYPISGMASVTQVATVGSISVGKVYAMIHSGELDSQRFGRSVRVPWTAVRDAGMI